MHQHHSSSDGSAKSIVVQIIAVKVGYGWTASFCCPAAPAGIRHHALRCGYPLRDLRERTVSGASTKGFNSSSFPIPSGFPGIVIQVPSGYLIFLNIYVSVNPYAHATKLRKVPISSDHVFRLHNAFHIQYSKNVFIVVYGPILVHIIRDDGIVPSHMVHHYMLFQSVK